MSTQSVAADAIPQSSAPQSEPERMNVEAGKNASAPIVVIVSREERISAAIAEHLSSLNVSIHRHESQETIEIEGLRELFPDVAFVDYSAVTADNFPLHKALRNAIPSCQIILLCSREQAAETAQLVRVWEVYDYLLTDCEPDPQRIRLMVERRKWTRCPSFRKSADSPNGRTEKFSNY